MTFFTLGGKCGAFTEPRTTPSPSSDASARRPTPMPQRPKKWRRGCMRESRASKGLSSFPRHEIVQVEQHARALRPRRKLRILGGSVFVTRECQEALQAFPLHRHRLASQCE